MAQTANINKAIATSMAIIKKSRGAISSMDANKWLAIVGLISALALGIGLVTSLVSVGLGWIINNEQKVEIAASNKEAKDAGERAANALKDAGVANEVAGKANERAEKLEGENLALRSQVATLETAASDAKKDVAGLQKIAADAQAELSKQQGRTATLESLAAVQQERAAKAEQELAELKRRQEPRRLQRDIFVSALKEKLPPNESWFGFAHIWYERDDLEAFTFAQQIKDAMNASGMWAVNEEPRPLPSEPPEPFMGHIPSLIRRGAGSGITVEGGRSLSVDALVYAFGKTGFPAAPSRYKATGEGGTLFIVIGPKP